MSRNVLIQIALLCAVLLPFGASAQGVEIEAEMVEPRLNHIGVLIGWTPLQAYGLSALDYERDVPNATASWSGELSFNRLITEHFQVGIAARYGRVGDGVAHLISVPLLCSLLLPVPGDGEVLIGVGTGYTMAAMLDDAYTTSDTQFAYGFTSEVSLGYAHQISLDLELMAQVGARFDLMQLESDDSASRYGMSPGSAVYSAIDFRVGTRWGF